MVKKKKKNVIPYKSWSYPSYVREKRTFLVKPIANGTKKQKKIDADFNKNLSKAH